MFIVRLTLEAWPSGWRHRSWKPATRKGSRVRISTLPPNSKPRSLCDLGFLFSVGFSMHADEAQERRSGTRHAGAVRERKALSAGHTTPCSIYSSTGCFIFFNIHSLVIPDFNGHTFFRIIKRCLHYPRHKSEQVLNNLSCFISFSASSLAWAAKLIKSWYGSLPTKPN